jgi:hypothetical protein
LSSAELFALECTFCGGQLISNTTVPKAASKFSRTSKLALGLLSASLSFGACDDEDEVVENTAGTEIIDAPAGMIEALYGAPPAGEMAGDEVMMEPAGEEIPQEVYGAPPAGEMAGTEEMAGGEGQ